MSLFSNAIKKRSTSLIIAAFGIANVLTIRALYDLLKIKDFMDQHTLMSWGAALVIVGLPMIVVATGLVWDVLYSILNYIRACIVANSLSHAFTKLENRFSSDAGLRTTIFIPDESNEVLTQLARYTKVGATRVSTTVVRMGTGDVGFAYTLRRPFRVHDIENAEVGFSLSLLRLGLTRREIQAHTLKDRKFFMSFPVFKSYVHQTPWNDGEVDDDVIAILSIDAAKPPTDAHDESWYRAFCEEVLPELSKAMQRNTWSSWK